MHANKANKKHSVICIEHALCDDAIQMKQKQNQNQKHITPTFKGSHVSVGRQKCKQMNQTYYIQRDSIIFYRRCKIFFKGGLIQNLYFNIPIILAKWVSFYLIWHQSKTNNLKLYKPGLHAMYIVFVCLFVFLT